MANTLFERMCNLLNKRVGWVFQNISIEWERSLEEALEFTSLKLKPREVVVFAWSTALLFGILTLVLTLLAFLTGMNPLYFLLGGSLLSILTLYAIPKYPERLVAIEKMRALSYAPDFIAYLMIPMKEDPNLEKASQFAAEHSTGRLQKELKKLIKDTWSGKYKSIGEALPILGYKWGEIKGLKEALYTIRTSQLEKSEERRLNALDRSLKDILEHTNEEFGRFIGQLEIPIRVLFMMGILIPLIFIMFIPAFSMLGLGLSSTNYIVMGLFLILLMVVLISEFILQSRPFTFSSISIPSEYPGLPPQGKIRILGKYASLRWISIGVAILISLLSLTYFLPISGDMPVLILIGERLNTLPIVFGIGTGLWIYFRYSSLPRLKIRNLVKEAEAESIEASFHLGNRLATGMSAEESLVRVSSMLSSQSSVLADILKKTTQNIRYGNLDFEEAFFHPEQGSLKNIHSKKIRAIFKMFIMGMKKSITSASHALITSANHLRDIDRVENSLRKRVSYTLSMMKVSTRLIVPALCGLSIPMVGMFNKIMGPAMLGSAMASPAGNLIPISLTTTSISVGFLTLVSGLYILSLLVILSRFVAILEHGEDRVMINLDISRGIPIALLVFTIVLSVVSFLLDKWLLV